MFFIKSLRAKTLVFALVPIAIVLVGVAIIALYAYDRVARDVVKQRDSELARISAARLSEALDRHSRLLSNIAAGEGVRSLDPVQLSSAMEKARHQLFVFDAGVVVYDDDGNMLWSQSPGAEGRSADLPVTAELRNVRDSLRPVFSNVFEDEISGEPVILIGVPIMSSHNQFVGMLAGMSNIRTSLVGATFAEVLELKPGPSGFAYLVDGNGRVIYHRHSHQLGKDLSTTVPVNRATNRETGAVFTEDSTGYTLVSGYAPVPGTGWGLITQERWESVIGPIQDYGAWILALLVAGGLLSAALIFFGIGRVLKPIRQLSIGAERIAGGDFDHTIVASTGDEVQALAQQFNTMAGVLKESYADLEQKVAARTEELTESEERYRTLFEDSNDAIFVSVDGKVVAVNQAALDMFGFTREEAIGLDVGERYVDPDDRGRFGQEIEETGLVKDFEVRLHKKDRTVIDCLLTATARSGADGSRHEVQGLVRDVTERKRTEQALRESEERYRRLVEDAADPFLVLESGGKIVDLNQRASEQWGYTREELLALSIEEIYVTMDRQRIEALYDGLVCDQVPVTLEGTGRRKDGSTFLIEVR